MKPRTFSELARCWLEITGGHLRDGSRHRYELAIRQAGQLITSLNGNLATELHQWESKRRAELSSSSFTVELGIVKAVLDWGRLVHNRPKEYKGWNEIKAGKSDAATFTIPTRDQFDAIITELHRQPGGETTGDFVELLGVSGMRRGELAALEWRDVSFDTGGVLIGRDGQSKTGTTRTLPMFDRLRAVLTRIYNRLPADQRQPTDRVTGEIKPEYRLQQAYPALGCPHFRVHDYRHFAAICFLQAVGIEQAHVSAAWLGHSVEIHLNRYTRHIAGNQSQELAKLVK